MKFLSQRQTLAIWLFSCFASLCHSFSISQRQRISRGLTTKAYSQSLNDGDGSSDINRRDLIHGAGSLFGGALAASTFFPSSVAAEESASDLLLRLRSIPTFCLVNPEGTPFMIFDGQASATGYFFLSFQVATQALQDAKQKDKAGQDIWSNAKIIVVPLAVALQLALRKTQRVAINSGNANGIKFNTYNDIVASIEGVDDAKIVERGNPDKWNQKGRVPLFYIEGLTLDNGKEPRYFNQQDLINEWNHQNSSKPLPPIQLVELVDLYRNALAKNGDLKKISKFAVMPVSETNQVASEMMKSSSSPMPKYNFNEVFLVGSSK